MLYSIQKTIDKNIIYPPELVVMVTADISLECRDALHPVLCTRILEVPVLGLPPGINKKISKNASSPWDNHCPGLTKLHAFRLDVYDTVVFIEPDCLVVDDIYPLIKRGKVYTEQEALVAAAPDVFPPDKFNSGVLVIRPSHAVFENMMGQKSLLANYDGSDTGFLNAFYPEWHTEMPPLARLPFTWNAQRALYDMTYENGHPNYWDLAISPDLHIVHYSGRPKPWEGSTQKVSHGGSKSTTDKSDYLTRLWQQYYYKSKNVVARYNKDNDRGNILNEISPMNQKEKDQQSASNGSMMHTIAVVSKCPIPGKTKTRLVPLLGEEGSSQLARAMLSDVLVSLDGTQELKNVRKILFYAPATLDGLHMMRALLTTLNLREIVPDDDSHGTDGWMLLPMNSTNLKSASLGYVLTDILKRVHSMSGEAGKGKVMFLGMDSPELPLEEIIGSFDSENDGKAFLCPANDGGYGMLCVPPEAPVEEVFQGIRWSDPLTALAQLKALSDCHIPTKIGTLMNDIDEADDVKALCERLAKKESGKRNYEIRDILLRSNCNGGRIQSCACLHTVNTLSGLGLLPDNASP